MFSIFIIRFVGLVFAVNICFYEVFSLIQSPKESYYKSDKLRASRDGGVSLGFIGLGIMGNGMARRLLQAGHDLNIWNRSTKKSAIISEEFPSKVFVQNSPSSVIENSDITFVMLSTPDACREVYEGESGILAGVSTGKMIIDCATLQPEDMKSLSLKVNSRGGFFLEAPVSGSKVPAMKGELVFMTAGDQSAYTAATPYLEIMGKSHYYVGSVGSGTRMKLVVNSIMANMLAALAEGLDLSSAASLDPKTVLSVIADGVMANPMFAIKGKVILNSIYIFIVVISLIVAIFKQYMIENEYPTNFPLKVQS